jgi:hypothetical protein
MPRLIDCRRFDWFAMLQFSNHPDVILHCTHNKTIAAFFALFHPFVKQKNRGGRAKVKGGISISPFFARNTRKLPPQRGVCSLSRRDIHDRSIPLFF